VDVSHCPRQPTTTKEDDSSYNKMVAVDLQLLLWASEPAETQDASGETIQVPWDRPVETFQEFLEQSSVAKARQTVNSKLHLQKKWHGAIPMSTALAMQNGTFVHENPNLVGPFSIFVMLPLVLAGCDPEEYLNIQLKSSEGKGLESTDIARMTKTIFSIPMDVHELGFFLMGFIHLLSYVFRPNALVTLAVHSWLPHMVNNFADYQDCFNADAMFGSRVCTLIDCKVQKYLMKGLNPSTCSRAEAHLAFGQYQQEIEDKEFWYQNRLTFWRYIRSGINLQAHNRVALSKQQELYQFRIQHHSPPSRLILNLFATYCLA